MISPAPQSVCLALMSPPTKKHCVLVILFGSFEHYCGELYYLASYQRFFIMFYGVFNDDPTTFLCVIVWVNSVVSVTASKLDVKFFSKSDEFLKSSAHLYFVYLEKLLVRTFCSECHWYSMWLLLFF